MKARMNSRRDSTAPRQRRWLPGLLACLLACFLTGCVSSRLLLANLPAYFGDVSRTSGIAYGQEAAQQLDIYTATGASSAAPRPVVVFFHGGSWQRGSRQQYRFIGGTLAQMGYVAVVPGYRLYPAATFPAFAEDGAAAVAWTLQHAAEYGGDPRKVFVMGHSAGAQIGALVALDSRYLRATGHATADVRGFIGLSGPYDFRRNTPLLKALFGANPDDRASQPIAWVRADAPRLLLIHGDADRVVEPGNSRRLNAAARRAGGASEMLIVPGMNHGGGLVALSAFGPSPSPIRLTLAAFIGQ
jgi:acetyl esterase/lipase